MKSWTTHWIAPFALLVASGLTSVACSDNEDGGTGGTGASGGTGGVTVQLPQCVLDGYHAIYREFWGSSSTGLHHILRTVDLNVPIDPSVIRRTKARFPDLADLPPIEDLSNPEVAKPRVLWATFAWPIVDVKRPRHEALFFQGLDEGIYGEEGEPSSRDFYLDSGFFQNTIAVVDWDIEEEDQLVGAGTFSVVGLDHDSVRVTLVRFPECRLLDTDPADTPLLCYDPEDENDPFYTDNVNPWYDDGSGCRFEVTSLGLHVDLEGTADPFVFSMEFIAEFGDAVRVPGLIVADADGTVNVTATYNGQPVSIDFDFDAGQLTVRFTGEPDTECTFETDSAEITECG